MQRCCNPVPTADYPESSYTRRTSSAEHGNALNGQRPCASTAWRRQPKQHSTPLDVHAGFFGGRRSHKGQRPAAAARAASRGSTSRGGGGRRTLSACCRASRASRARGANHHSSTLKDSTAATTLARDRAEASCQPRTPVAARRRTTPLSLRAAAAKARDSLSPCSFAFLAWKGPQERTGSGAQPGAGMGAQQGCQPAHRFGRCQPPLHHASQAEKGRPVRGSAQEEGALWRPQAQPVSAGVSQCVLAQGRGWGRGRGGGGGGIASDLVEEVQRARCCEHDGRPSAQKRPPQPREGMCQPVPGPVPAWCRRSCARSRLIILGHGLAVWSALAFAPASPLPALARRHNLRSGACSVPAEVYEPPHRPRILRTRLAGVAPVPTPRLASPLYPLLFPFPFLPAPLRSLLAGVPFRLLLPPTAPLWCCRLQPLCLLLLRRRLLKPVQRVLSANLGRGRTVFVA